MNKILLYFITIFLISLSLLVNSQTIQHRCGYDLAIQNHNNIYPGYYDYTKASFEHIKNSYDAHKSGDELTVKVVVHVVYANQDENIAEERVNRVIDAINEDFNGNNSIDRGLREDFHNVVGNSEINFKLEGIEYVPSTSDFAVDFLTGTLPDNVKTSSTGGSDAWDPNEYLNIWVCNIQSDLGRLLGYAYPPSCAPNWPDGSVAPSPELDGVVMHFEAFDTEGFIIEMGQEIQIRAKSLSHEIGHYFGLRHIWGDGQLALFGIPDCSVDDGISDTPNQGLPSGGCDDLNNTCTDPGTDLPDMYENFMDYSEEPCQNTFTIEQVQIMRSSILNCRMDILSDSKEPTLYVQSFWDAYPNPISSENLKITIKHPSSAKHLISIFNYQGQKLITRELNSGLNELNISNLDQGIYILKVTNVNGKTSIKKLLKH